MATEPASCYLKGKADKALQGSLNDQSLVAAELNDYPLLKWATPILIP
jgi:hypothetical protein